MRARARSAGVGDGAETTRSDSASSVPGEVVSMPLQAYRKPPSASGRTWNEAPSMRVAPESSAAFRAGPRPAHPFRDELPCRAST